MKRKLFTILLCIAVLLGATSFIACDNGGNAYFNGNYEEATASEIVSLSETITSNQEATTLDWTKGFKVDFELNGNMGYGNVAVKFNYEVGLNEGGLIAAGNIDMYDVESTVKGKIYYYDGYSYVDGSVGVIGGASASGKFKQETSYEGLINEYGITMVLIEDLGDVIPYLSMYEEINYYIDQNEDNTKIKIDIPTQTITEEGSGYTRASTGSGTYVFVYDTEYNLIGLQLESSSTSTITAPQGSSQQVMNAKLTIVPSDGVIELPSNLDTYVEM